MYIRRFASTDADAVVRVSELATRITSGAVYDAAFVEEMVTKQDRGYFLTRGEQMHFYVACEDDGTVIGCAAFGPSKAVPRPAGRRRGRRCNRVPDKNAAR